MATLTMMGGKMVVTAQTEAEEKELTKLAYDGAKVDIEKTQPKPRAKKADAPADAD